MRAVFFFDGNDDAGLRAAIVVLWIWALGSLLVGGLVAGAISRREVRERRAALPAG
jgi:cytochrome c-type biogenesis protein CcmH/NrfF